MQNLLRLLLVLGLAGSGLTFAGSAAAWWLDESGDWCGWCGAVWAASRTGSSSRAAHAAAGFGWPGQLVVMRRGGAQALLYPLRALIGAELIVDGCRRLAPSAMSRAARWTRSPALRTG